MNMSLTQKSIMLSLKEKVIIAVAGTTLVSAGTWLGYKLMKGISAKKQADLEFQAACKKGIENFFAKKSFIETFSPDSFKKNWEETEFVAS